MPNIITISFLLICIVSGCYICYHTRLLISGNYGIRREIGYTTLLLSLFAVMKGIWVLFESNLEQYRLIFLILYQLFIFGMTLLSISYPIHLWLESMNTIAKTKIIGNNNEVTNATVAVLDVDSNSMRKVKSGSNSILAKPKLGNSSSSDSPRGKRIEEMQIEIATFISKKEGFDLFIQHLASEFAPGI